MIWLWQIIISNIFLHSFELPRLFRSTGKFLVHGLSTGLLNSTPIEVVANVQNIGGVLKKKGQSVEQRRLESQNIGLPATSNLSLRAALALKALATKICGLSSTPETLKRLFNFMIFSQKFICQGEKKIEKTMRINAGFWILLKVIRPQVSWEDAPGT